MNYQDYFKSLLSKIVKNLLEESKIKTEEVDNLFSLEIPPNEKYGELSTNLALVTSKFFKKNPLDLAKNISLKILENKYVKEVKVEGPGFINLFLEKFFWYNQLEFLASNLINFNNGVIKKKFCVEYVSANPTGILHIGHARGAVLGDSIASLLEEVGHKVDREYYINDAGEQIKKLVKTILHYIDYPDSDPYNLDKDLYPGEYLKNKTKDIIHEIKNKSESEIEPIIIESILDDIKSDLKKIGIKFKHFVSEKGMASKNNIKNLKKKLDNLNLSYHGYQDQPDSLNREKWKKEKKLLFKSTLFGDDKDRALEKSNGELTYFMTDIIYHSNKIERGYDSLVNIWGADHSGYVKRLQNAVYKICDNQSFDFKIILTGLVNLYENKKLLKMSKRAGNFLTLYDVLKKVDSDALRFMMISRDSKNTIDFDFKFVQEKNKDNPVFYVQYAHARCKSLISIFENIFKGSNKNINLENLILKEEIDLIKNLSNFTNVILKSAKLYEPHRITNYLYNLAKLFHNYWGLGKINSQNKIIVETNYDLSNSRIYLVKSVSLIIKKGLDILKINCPDSM